MNRFWIFPFVVGFFGAALPVLAIEGALPLMLIPGLTVSAPPLHSLFKVMIGSFFIGALFGLGVAVSDLSRNGRVARRGSQLASNIAWCLLYAHIFILVNMGLAALWITQRDPSVLIIVPAIWLPGVLCLVAIAWGTIRTVSAGDVLNPRVLGAKLKRSAQVEG